jgi:hypothetical protein
VKHDLRESGKELTKLRRLDPSPGVLHTDIDLLILNLCYYLHKPFLSVFDSVRNEVYDDLLQAVTIDPYFLGLIEPEFGHELDTLGFRFKPESIHTLGDNLCKIYYLIHVKDDKVLLYLG